MKRIGDFLIEVKKFRKPDIIIREKTREAVKKYIGIDVDIKNIKFRNNIIFIQTSDHLLKSEIFIKKKKILEFIQDLSDNKNIKDIK